jgi:hypothetical protein
MMTREEWLNKALHKHVAPLLAKHGATVPKDCLVSVGWPGGGSARKRIGEACVGALDHGLLPVLRQRGGVVVTRNDKAEMQGLLVVAGASFLAGWWPLTIMALVLVGLALSESLFD